MSKPSANLEKNFLGLSDRPALVVVDMINGFTDPECPLGSYCPDVVRANIELLEAFRSKEMPIFFTTVVYFNDHEASVFRKKVPALNLLQPSSHWIAVDEKLEKRGNEVLIEKQWASAFFDTDLDLQLSQLEVDSLVVTGLTTSGCVRASVVDGLQNNYQVVVAEEAVGDRNQDAHNANLFDMNAKYADVVPVKFVRDSLGF
ncbi:MAG: isochorismatase [Porticoccaceae bacterium]|nr:isochorismatase [Porticoccaceae bacterium]